MCFLNSLLKEGVMHLDRCHSIIDIQMQLNVTLNRPADHNERSELSLNTLRRVFWRPLSLYKFLMRMKKIILEFLFSRNRTTY